MLRVQRGTDIRHVSHASQFTFSVACITTAFYLFVGIFAFFPYKEFKTIEFTNNPGYAEFMRTSESKTQEQPSDPYNPDYINSDEDNEGNAKKEQGTF